MVVQDVAPAPSVKDLYGPTSLNNFKLEESSSLFGIETLLPTSYVYDGPPFRVGVTDGTKDFKLRKLVFKDPLTLSSFVPAFRDTPFDLFTLRQVVISEQSLRRSSGWHIDADVVIDNSFGPLHDLLADFFNNPNPSIHVHAELGHVADRNSPLSLSFFALEGTVGEHDKINISLCDSVSATRLGVRLNGFQRTKYNAAGRLSSKPDYGFSVFGTLDFRLSNWKQPVQLDFQVSHMGGQFFLHARIDTHWDNAFNIPSLKLDSFSISTSFQTKSPFQSLSFGVETEFHIGSALAVFDGHLSMNGDFELSAHVEDLHWKDMANLYSSFCGGSLKTPDFHFYLREGTVTFSNSGIALEIRGLEIGGSPPCDANITLGPNGFKCIATLRGTLQLTEDFALSEPLIEANIPRGEQGGSAKLLVKGIFKWKESYRFEVGAHIYRVPDDDSTHFTIYGAYCSGKGGLSLGSLIPQLSDCVALRDVALDSLALTYATREDSELGALVGPKYKIKRGFYICCAIKRLGGLESFQSKKDAPSDDHPILVGYLGYDETNFELAISYVEPVKLPFGNVTMKNVEFAAVLGAPPQLVLSAELIIPIEGQKDLIFDLSCAIDPKSRLDIRGQLRGLNWVNPFGLCEDLVIGPKVGASFAIILSTLTPDGFSLAADFKLKYLKVSMEMEVNVSNPREQFLYLKMQNLDIYDLAEVAKTLTRIELGIPPNVVFFNLLELYICPFGTKEHKQGFSFTSDMVICNKKAFVHATISKSLVKMDVKIDPFKIGDYSIRSTSGGPSVLKLELAGFTKQEGEIDAHISGPHLDAKMKGMFRLQPSLIVDFNFELKIDNDIYCQMFASSGYELSERQNDLSKVDFVVKGTLSATPGSLSRLLASIKKSVKAELDSARESLQQTANLLNSQALQEAAKSPRVSDFDRAFIGLATKVTNVINDTVQRMPKVSDILDLPGPQSELAAALSVIYNSLEIQNVYFDGVLGISNSVLKFNARIVGRVAGNPIDITVELDLSQYLQFINTLIDRLKAFVKQLSQEVIRAFR